MIFDGNVLNGNKGPERDLKGKLIATHIETNLTEKVSWTNICLTCTCFSLSLSQKFLRGLSWANAFLLGGLARNTHDGNKVCFSSCAVFSSVRV